METIYKPKRLRRAGAVLTAIFTMLLLSAFVAHAQTTILDLKIECYGIVKVKEPTNTQASYVIQGPVATSLIDKEGFAGNEIWYFKYIPDPGYEWIGWGGANGTDVVPLTPSDLGCCPEPQGYTHKIIMTANKQVTAIFGMVDLPTPGMFMSADFTIKTIPGTDAAAKGTPVIVPITATYPVIAPGSYPDVRADALLSTNRSGGFAGIRILDISPLPAGWTVGTIELGTIPGLDGYTGNNILLSDIFDIIGAPNDFTPPLLEDESGKTINWVFTLDGLNEGDPTNFYVDVATIAYQDADVDFDADLCETILADTRIYVVLAECTQTLSTSEIVNCNSSFAFSNTIQYPAIQNIDLAGEIKNNGYFISDKLIPSGTTIAWTYTQVTPAGGSQNAVYNVTADIAAGTKVWLSDMINQDFSGTAPTPLVGHNGLKVKWDFVITFPTGNKSSGIYNIDLQSVVQLGGVDYKYGDLQEIKIVNTKIYNGVVNIVPTGPINAVTKTPIIVPVQTTIPAAANAPSGKLFNTDHAGIMLDGKIKLTSGTFPSGAKLLGARYKFASASNWTELTILSGGTLSGSEKLFSALFSGTTPALPADVTTLASGWGSVVWEFDIDGVPSGTSTWNQLAVELFTYYGTSPLCQVAQDVVTVNWKDAAFTATTPSANVCLNDTIPITVTFDFPTITDIEPTPLDIYTDVIVKNTAHVIPAGTKIQWYYGATAKGLFSVVADIPVNTEIMLSAIIAGSTNKVGTVPDKLINAVDVAWTFNFFIPGNFDPPTDLTGVANKGTYTLNFKPIVKLFSYPNFIYMPDPNSSRNVTFTIGTYALTMAADPDYAGTTNPAIPGPYNIGCGTLVKVIATPSELGGWFFDYWSSEMDCAGTRDIPAYDNFADFEANPTWYRMPACNAEVTAHFDQEEYEFVIGVVGCGQKVIVWTDGESTPFELTGNRECADIEPTSGTFLTFTHGETVLLEVIPTTGWTWGEWIFCDPTDDGEPLDDADFTYLGLNDAGHHVYELVFRSDKELKAIFRKNLTANIVINDKTYDGTTTATINQSASSITGWTSCPTYDCTVDFDWSPLPTANFIDKNATWNGTMYITKQVNITGLNLTMNDDCYYILGPTTYDEETGYGVPGSTATGAAKIFRKCVNVYAKADNKIYDGTTAAVVSKNEPSPIDGANDGFKGFVSGDAVTGTINPAGTFASKNVGTWNVTYSASLAGTDAPNYVLNCPEGAGYPVIQATISCKQLSLPNIVIADKQYDGQDWAKVTSWGNLVGVLPSETSIVFMNPVPAQPPYFAWYDDPWVAGDEDVTVYVTMDFVGGSGKGNYCLGTQYTGGNIIVPPYAMFDPTYQKSCDPECEPDIINVPVERTFTITFSQDIYNYMAQELPTSGTGLGNFIRLEKYKLSGEPGCHEYIYPDPTKWETVPFWSIRSGRVITVYPGTPETEVRVDLEWDKYYRIVYGDIWAYNNVTGLLERVEYRLDQDDYEFDEEASCAFEHSRQIIFKTIPQLVSPVVEPSGCEGVEIAYNAPIKIHFVNPVKYTNGNMISGELGEPTHKFEMWASPKYGPEVGTWKKVLFQAQASDFAEALPQHPGTFGPMTITLYPVASAGNSEYWAHPANEMLHCYNYYVIFRDGFLDNGAGFIDMTDFGRVCADGNPSTPDLEWEWCTTCLFDMKVMYDANSGVVYNSDRNNMFLKQLSGSTWVTKKNLWSDGTAYGTNGKQVTYNVNMLPYAQQYRFESKIGEGYHIQANPPLPGVATTTGWTRNGVKVWYNSSVWKYQASQPAIGWALFNNQNQLPAWPAWPSTQMPFIQWQADPAVPFVVYEWKVYYEYNKYTIQAKANPAQIPDDSGVSFTGNDNTWYTTPTKYVSHNETVTIKSRPMAGYYTPSWSYNPPSTGVALPGSVQATIGPSDVTNYWYDPEAPAKPGFVTPKDGFITFDMVGKDPVHEYTYTVEANFAKFYPRIDVEVVPALPACNYVTYTAQFVQGQDWGITFAAQNYAVFKYGTPVTLETHACACGWEFDYFEVWDGTMVGSERHYVPFNPTEWMPITSNLDIKAHFKKTAYHISAVTNPASKGSVLIQGVNKNGVAVSLIDAAATAGDDFIYDTELTLTVYPEPGYEAAIPPFTSTNLFPWNNDNVTFVANYIDRSVWKYVVGANNCEQPYALSVNITKRKYTVTAVPYYNGIQSTQGGKVAGLPSGSGVNKFTNNTSAGTATGTFEHFFDGATLTATPSSSLYVFSYWYDEAYGNIGSANPLTLPGITGPRTIHAVFAPNVPMYALTVVHDPSVAGTETVKQNDVVKYAPYSFWSHKVIDDGNWLSVITVIAQPELGYEFTGWTVTQGTIVPIAPYGLSNSTLKFNMPAMAVGLKANYVKKQYALEMNVRTYLRPAGSGDIVNYGGILTDLTGTAPYNFGETITLKAAPIPGFTFVNWMVGTLSDDPLYPGVDTRILTGYQIYSAGAPVPYPGTVTFNYTIPQENPPLVGSKIVLYALFVETAFPQYPIYTLNTEAWPADKGITWGDGIYPATVIAMVGQEPTTPGWGFEGWSPNVIPDGYGDGTVVMTGLDYTPTATAYYDLTEYYLYVEPIGSGCVYGDTYFNIESDPIPIDASECVCNYEFVGWYYDYMCNIPVTDALGNPITDPEFGWIPVPLPEGDDYITIYGLFDEIEYYVGLEVNRDYCGGAEMGGTAEVLEGAGPWYLDDQVTLLATPAPGYNFMYWANPMCEVLVEQPQFIKTITCGMNDFIAVFEAIPYNVTLSQIGCGTIGGGGVYYVGDNVTITAAPCTGWVFNGWYQGTTLISTSPSYAFVMPPNHVAYTAKFTITQVTLNLTKDDPSGLCSVTVKNGATVLTPPYTVDYGTVLTLDPAPDGLFLNWTGDLTGTANPASLTMNGAKTVVAHFASCNPVTNLASTTTAKTATVTWTTPAGQTAELRYKLSTASWPTTAPYGWAAATSPKTITGLTPDKTYNVEVRTVCGTGIYATTVAGTFTTKKLGDVNCDGFLTVLDVQILTNYIMGSQAWTQCIGDGGDINGDGQINVLDIVALINIILGQTGKAAVMSIPADIYLASDGIMFNSDGTVSGLQFELEGPQVSDLKLTLALTGYELTYSVEGSTLTGMIYNLDNEPIPAGMINLVSMAAEGTIEWGNVIGANYGESEVQVNKHGALSDAFSLMVYPNPTKGEINALFNVPADAKVNIRLLDFSGRVISELTDAIYDYGEHLINWTNAQTLTTGLYILQMNAITNDASHQVYRQEVKVVIIK